MIAIQRLDCVKGTWYNTLFGLCLKALGVRMLAYIIQFCGLKKSMFQNTEVKTKGVTC